MITIWPKPGLTVPLAICWAVGVAFVVAKSFWLFGIKKLGVFVRLKISVLNCNVNLSVREKSLKTENANDLKCGP